MEMTTAVAATTWEHGRFDARDGPHKLLFGRMYEDAAIEGNAFRLGGRVFCIASAGCTAMKLTPHHEVVAVDINPVQLAYVEHRLNGGSSRAGTAERILAFARALGPLTGWWPSRVRVFLDLNDPVEQMVYWRRDLDTRRFRAALDLLFSAPTLRSIYASSFLHFLPPNLGAVMRRRMERCFASLPNRTNPYARALFLGEMPNERLPPEVKNIRLMHADAATFLESEPVGSFDGFTLSNILDGASVAYEQRLFAAVKRAAAPGAVVVLRSFREPPFMLPTNRATEDRAMLWGIVDVRPAIEL
jgi:S-adenosylmethionine:diacylglycerol 3-amino-3-carboxypropyl transferase